MANRETYDLLTNASADGAGTAITDGDKFDQIVVEVITTNNFTGDIDFYESNSPAEPVWTDPASQTNRYFPSALKDKSNQSLLTGTLQPAGVDVIKNFAVLDSKNLRNFNVVVSSYVQGNVWVRAFGVKDNQQI